MKNRVPLTFVRLWGSELPAPGFERLADEGRQVKLDAEPRPVGNSDVPVLENQRFADQVARWAALVGLVFQNQKVRRGRREVNGHRP